MKLSDFWKFRKHRDYRVNSAASVWDDQAVESLLRARPTDFSASLVRADGRRLRRRRQNALAGGLGFALCLVVVTWHLVSLPHTAGVVYTPAEVEGVLAVVDSEMKQAWLPDSQTAWVPTQAVSEDWVELYPK